MYYIMLIFVAILALTLFFFLINLKWCVRTIRDISHPKNQGGYTKLIQILIIGLLSLIFFLIFLYYIFNEGEVSRIDLILTVIVGWLGAIISRFFGERAMENLDEKRKNNAEKMIPVLNKYEEFLDQVFPELKKK